MNNFFTLLLSFSTVALPAQDNLAQYVNPFIGTHKMGHTFPGATVPFGMVQLRKAIRSIMPCLLQEVC